MASNSGHEKGSKKKSYQTSLLFISLPKCGSILTSGEKLYVNGKIFTSSLTLPMADGPICLGFGLLISPSYKSGSRNSPLGFELNFFLKGGSYVCCNNIVPISR